MVSLHKSMKGMFKKANGEYIIVFVFLRNIYANDTP